MTYKKRSIALVGILAVSASLLLSGCITPDKAPEMTGDKPIDQLDQKNEAVEEGVSYEEKNLAVEINQPQVGDQIKVKNKSYLIIQTMNSTDIKTQVRILIEDTSANADFIAQNKEDEHFLKSLRCYESDLKYLGDYFKPMYVSIWSKETGELLEFQPDYSVEKLARANSCVEIVKAVSANELLVLLTAGDGMGSSQQVYRYQLEPKKLSSLFGFRLFAQFVDDSNDIDKNIYHAWVKDEMLLVQVEGRDDNYSPLFRVIDPKASDLFYTFDDVVLEDVVVQTNKKVEADILSNQNLTNFVSGLQFQIEGKEVFVSWE